MTSSRISRTNSAKGAIVIDYLMAPCPCRTYLSFEDNCTQALTWRVDLKHKRAYVGVECAFPCHVRMQRCHTEKAGLTA